MLPILGGLWLDLRHLGDLKAAGVWVGRLRQRPPAAFALRWEEIHEVVDLSAARSSRCEPLWPRCPPRLRFLPSPGFCFDAAPPPRAPGPSLDGGRWELREFWPSFSSSVATWVSNAATLSANCALVALRSAISCSRWSTRKRRSCPEPFVAHLFFAAHNRSKSGTFHYT